MGVEAVIATQVIDTTAVGRSLMTAVDAAAARTALSLGTLATQSGTFSGTSSGTNTGDQDLSGYLTSVAAAAAYQVILVSGTNIKTVNGSTLLGSGDLTISGLSGTGSVDNAALRADGTGGATLQSSAWIIADNYTASPNNTVNHASLQATGGTTNVSASIVPKGTGAFCLAVPDSSATGGNVRGDNAVDLQTSRGAATQVASGQYSSILGGNSNTASGTASTACGTTSIASGNRSFAGGEGITSINSQFTITVTGATTFTLDGHTCAGTYTANTARVTTAGVATARSHRQELTAYRIGDSMQTHRIVEHRSKNYDFPDYGDAFGYYAGPRASISRDGRYTAYASNMGNPEWPSVYVADLGFGSATGVSSSVTPADTKAIINYVVPAGQGAATITISASASLASPVVSAPNSTRQYVATGLTAGTLYYYRVQTEGFAYTGQFVTLPTLSGSGRLQVVKGGGGTVQYGTTTGLGSSCASPCDVTVARGIIYTDVTGAVVVR